MPLTLNIMSLCLRFVIISNALLDVIAGTQSTAPLSNEDCECNCYSMVYACLTGQEENKREDGESLCKQFEEQLACLQSLSEECASCEDFKEVISKTRDDVRSVCTDDDSGRCHKGKSCDLLMSQCLHATNAYHVAVEDYASENMCKQFEEQLACLQSLSEECASCEDFKEVISKTRDDVRSVCTDDDSGRCHKGKSCDLLMSQCLHATNANHVAVEDYASENMCKEFEEQLACLQSLSEECASCEDFKEVISKTRDDVRSVCTDDDSGRDHKAKSCDLLMSQCLHATNAYHVAVEDYASENMCKLLEAELKCLDDMQKHCHMNENMINMVSVSKKAKELACAYKEEEPITERITTPSPPTTTTGNADPQTWCLPKFNACMQPSRNFTPKRRPSISKQYCQLFKVEIACLYELPSVCKAESNIKEYIGIIEDMKESQCGYERHG